MLIPEPLSNFVLIHSSPPGCKSNSNGSLATFAQRSATLVCAKNTFTGAKSGSK